MLVTLRTLQFPTAPLKLAQPAKQPLKLVVLILGKSVAVAFKLLQPRKASAVEMSRAFHLETFNILRWSCKLSVLTKNLHPLHVPLIVTV